MKNAWALFNPETNERIGYGNGHIDLSMIGNARVVWRDTLAEILALPAVRQASNKQAAESIVISAQSPEREQAKARKADCARRFLDDVPEPSKINPADPQAISVDYLELFDEYWQTFDVTTTATNPWHLAKLIVQKAREKGEAETRAASIAEAQLRRAKVLAEITLSEKNEMIPNE